MQAGIVNYLMEVLPKGTTGIECDHSVMRWGDIRKPIVRAIFAVGAKVELEIPCEGKVEPNYHFVTATHRSIPVHSLFRYVAYTNVKTPPYMNVTFVDWPELSRELASLAELQSLSAEFLNQPVSEYLIRGLYPVELKEIHIGNLR